MIKKIVIKGYKCFSDFELNLENSPLVFFSGANGVGKSTIFEVLTLIRDIVCRGQELVSEDGTFRVMGDTLTRWNEEAEEQSFALSVVLKQRRYEYRLLVDSNTQNGYPRIREEVLTCDGTTLYKCVEGDMNIYDSQGKPKVTFHVDWGKSFIASIAERPENKLLMTFRKWLSGLIYIKPIPTQMSSVAQTELQMPDRELRNFASWFRYLKQSGGDDRYYHFLKDAKIVIPGLSGMTLVDVGDKSKELKVEVKAAGVKKAYSFAELSEGQRMLIALYAIVHFVISDGATICIDEPDNYLSMGEVSSLIETLRDACEEVSTGQVMVVSHHPEFYKQTGVEYGYIVSRSLDGRISARNIRQLVSSGVGPLPVDDVIARGWEA